MFVVKIKYKKSLETYYVNCSIIHPTKDIRKENANFKINLFILSYKEAKKLFLELIKRDAYWEYSEDRLDYVAIVELSNYKPHTEHEVVNYREFK